MYDYDKMKRSIQNKKDEDFEALKSEISGIESLIEKCLKVVFENSASKSERDFNVSSL